MDLRPDARHKENVPPRPATPLRAGKRLKPRRLLATQSLDVVLGRWVPRSQAERGGPATSPSPGTVLLRDACRVQTNLASPGPHLGRALKPTTGPNGLSNSSFQQQCNLRPLHNLPQRGARVLAVQQSNLGRGEASLAECGICSSPHLWSEPPESFWPHMMPLGRPLHRGPRACSSSTPKQSWLLPRDAPCLDFRPTACHAPVDGHTQPGPSFWGGLGSRTSGLIGEPLTLEDLAVPAKSQAQALSQMLASVQRLEHKVAYLRCRGTQEPPVPSQQEPWTSDGQGLPACPQACGPVLASWSKRKRYPCCLRGAVNFPGTPGSQLGPSDSQAGSKPTSPPPGTTSEVLTGDFLNSEQYILPAYALKQGERPHTAEEQSLKHCEPGVGDSLWRKLTRQQKQEQPYIQAGPGPPPPGGGRSGRKPAVDPAQ